MIHIIAMFLLAVLIFIYWSLFAAAKRADRIAKQAFDKWMKERGSSEAV